MKKLLLLALVAFAVLATGCDREKYAAHRSERSKPKTEVTTDRIAIRRAPFPNLDILPDGQLRVDDIEIPLKPEQRELLQTSFVKLQILRQNTLTDSTAPADASGRTVPLEAAGAADDAPRTPAGAWGGVDLNQRVGSTMAANVRVIPISTRMQSPNRAGTRRTGRQRATKAATPWCFSRAPSRSWSCSPARWGA